MMYLLIAAVLWGVTNPLLKRHSAGLVSTDSNAATRTWVDDLRFLFRRPMYLAVQALNLSGSVFFFLSLRETAVSVASIVANSLAFVITLLMSVAVLRECELQWKTYVGAALVVAGTSLCTAAAAVAS